MNHHQLNKVIDRVQQAQKVYWQTGPEALETTLSYVWLAIEDLKLIATEIRDELEHVSPPNINETGKWWRA